MRERKEYRDVQTIVRVIARLSLGNYDYRGWARSIRKEEAWLLDSVSIWIYL